MKKLFHILPLVILFTLIIQKTTAQSQWVVSLGVSPQQSPEGHYIFANRSIPKDEFTFNIQTVKPSVFLGVGKRFNMSRFFIQTEAQYNRQQYVYELEYTYPEFVRSEDIVEYNESMHMLYLPVTIGVDLGLMEFSSGFTPQVVLAHESDMDHLEGYAENLNTLQFGWNTGLAASWNAFRFGLNFQMDFKRYADHMTMNGESLALKGKPSRLVGSVSYIF